MSRQWEIFCAVVDNFGDIGVTWRLARQLVVEHQQSVRLWVDQPELLARLHPDARPQRRPQWVDGVEVRHWNGEEHQLPPGEVVIEAFGCHLSDAYQQAMAERPTPPCWINLEYLSAEDWVEQCHRLPSLQANGLQKFFFFPGFTPTTGGLLRESSLSTERPAFQRTPEPALQWLQRWYQPDPQALRLSLFAYENAALGEWLDRLSQGPACELLIPEGRIVPSLQQWLGVEAISAGQKFQRGALQLVILPFMSQIEYDHLLWSCDLNFVRGEDSFVRAQWADRPLIWQIYPQQEAAHWPKLEAFWQLYQTAFNAEAAHALQSCWWAWNRQQGMAQAWDRLTPHWRALRDGAQQWQQQLQQQADLATQLMHFCTKSL